MVPRHGPEYFRGGGYSSGFLTRGGMPVTMMRLNLVKGLGPVLQIAEGWTVDLPADVHETLDERTNPTWPTHWFVPRLTGSGPFRDVYSVMANWGANHGALSYGHIGADLIALAFRPAHPGCHAQPARGKPLPPQRLGHVRRDGSAGRRFPRLPEFRPDLRQVLTQGGRNSVSGAKSGKQKSIGAAGGLRGEAGNGR